MSEPTNRLRAGVSITVVALMIAGSSVVAVAADFSNVAALFEQSFAAEARGKTRTALSNVLSILKKDSDHYVANLRAGWLSYKSGKYADSVIWYRKAAQLMPDAIEPQLGLMLPLMAAKRWAEAERVGVDLLRVDTRSYLIRSRLAFVYYSRGRWSKAEGLYASVLTDYPSDLDISSGLAWTWLKQGKSQNATELFDRVLSVNASHQSAAAGRAAAGR